MPLLSAFEAHLISTLGARGLGLAAATRACDRIFTVRLRTPLQLAVLTHLDIHLCLLVGVNYVA